MKPGGKLRAGRRPLKVEPKEQVLAKKAFHHLKILKKDIKKAKEFEVRKILRRIKQAKAEPNGKAGAAAGLDKLEAQLAAAKAADVEQLAAQAARSCPVLMPTLQGSGQGQMAAAHQDEQPEPSAAAEAPPCSPQSVQQVVHARILGAKAVKDRLAEVQLEMQRVGEAASKRETAAAARTAPPAAATDAGGEAGEQAVAAGSKKRKERPAKLGTGVAGSGEEQEVQQQVAKRHRQQQQAEGAGGDDVASGALAKLLGASMGRGPPAAAPGAAAAAAGGSDDSDDDSGIFQSASDDEQLLLSGGSSDAEEGGRLPSGAGGSDVDSDDAAAVQHRQQQQAAAGVPGRERSGQQQAKRGGDQPPQQQQQQQQQKKKKEAPKSKNRLGQRARRLMAAMQYGRTAKHLQESPQQQGQDRPIPGQAALQVQRKPPPQQPASKDMASLHPSWAAKQAQKQKLQISIAGGSSPAKKIVFGDDGSQQHKPSARGGTRPHQELSGGGAQAIKPVAATTGKLHPSWEAKKRQQEQQKKMMLPAAGTKIVFGDDD
ncbi:hypothetical protein ACK3TF_001098 [Chlorella vulgaris]